MSRHTSPRGRRASVAHLAAGMSAARRRALSRDTQPPGSIAAEALPPEQIAQAEARRASLQRDLARGQFTAVAIANAATECELAKWKSIRANSPSQRSKRSQNSSNRSALGAVFDTSQRLVIAGLNHIRKHRLSIATTEILFEPENPAASTQIKFTDAKAFLESPDVTRVQKFAYRLAHFNNELATSGTAFTKLLSIFGATFSILLCTKNNNDRLSIPVVCACLALGCIASYITYIQRHPYLTAPANQTLNNRYGIQSPTYEPKKWNRCIASIFFFETILGALFAGLPYAAGILILSGACMNWMTAIFMLLAFLPAASKNYLAESTKQRQLYEKKLAKKPIISSCWNDSAHFFLYAMASFYPYFNSLIGSYGIYILIPELVGTLASTTGNEMNSSALVATKGMSAFLAYLALVVVTDAYFYFDGAIMRKRVSEFKPGMTPTIQREEISHPNKLNLLIGFPARWLTRKNAVRDLTIKMSSAFLVAAITSKFSNTPIAKLAGIHPNVALDFSLTAVGMLFGFMMGGGISRSKLPKVPSFEKFKIPTNKAWCWFTCQRYTEPSNLSRSSSNLSTLFRDTARVVINPIRAARIKHRRDAAQTRRRSSSSTTSRNHSPHPQQFTSSHSFTRPMTPTMSSNAGSARSLGHGAYTPKENTAEGDSPIRPSCKK